MNTSRGEGQSHWRLREDGAQIKENTMICRFSFTRFVITGLATVLVMIAGAGATLAAGAALAPTSLMLRASAIDLLDAMIAVGKVPS